MTYTVVVSCGDFDDFVKRVNEHLASGWSLHGNLAISQVKWSETYGPHDEPETETETEIVTTFAQAMTRSGLVG